MAKVNSVIVQSSNYLVEGVVYYDNGTRRQYDLGAGRFPNTVKRFMETAKNVEEKTEDIGGGVIVTTKTYEN